MRAWRDLVDDATSQLGPVSPALVRHWRAELDEVERRVALLEYAAPVDSADDGLHAFVALATARLADAWDPAQLIDAATAVELAHRASQHHRQVVETAVDSIKRPDGERCPNTRVVLDGDWSITQAAVLVAGIGPAAYRCLVRGYGSTQVGQIFGDAEPLALMKAAVELAALVADLPDDAVRSLWANASAASTGSAGTPAARAPAAAGRAASVPAAVVAWAISSYVSDGTTNARNVAAREPRPAANRRPTAVEINHDEPRGRQVVAQSRRYLVCGVVGSIVAEQRQCELMQAGVVAAQQHGGCIGGHLAKRLQQSSRIGEVQLAVELQRCGGDRRLGLRDELDGLASPGGRRAEHEIERTSVELVGDAARDTGQHRDAARRQGAVVISTAGRGRMGRRFRVPQDEQPMHQHSVVCARSRCYKEVRATAAACYREVRAAGRACAGGACCWWRFQFRVRVADE